jgi:hypothetical protein
MPSDRSDVDDDASTAKQSGGNLLFVLQGVWMLLDRPDIVTGPPPDSVPLVIAARLDHSNDCRRTAHARHLRSVDRWPAPTR